MATISKGKTFTDGELVTPAKLHQLVDSAQVTGIVNADIAAGAAIADTKLAAITTPDKVSPAAVTGLVNDLTILANVLGSHTHDDRYYTETEIDTKLAGLPVSGHTHSAADITSGTLAIARIPTGTTSTTVSLGNHTHSAADITSGTLANARTTATSANTASAIVARDASNNFSAGTITAALSGNATSATNLAGGSAGAVPYQSAAGNTAMLAAGTTGQVLRSNGAAAPSWLTLAASATTDTTNATNIASGTLAIARIPTGTTGTAVALGDHTHSAATTSAAGFLSAADKTKLDAATNANTGNTIVARDASGNFSAGSITASSATSSFGSVRVGRGSGTDATNTALGGGAPLSSITNGANNTAIGFDSQKLTTTGTRNVSVGQEALFNNLDGASNVAIGTAAANKNTSGTFNTAVGNSAIFSNVGGIGNTALGASALSAHTTKNWATAVGAFAGSNGHFANSTCIGYSAEVTADNQVQLGNSDTTTFAYGAVQNRSDARDKTDIRPTVLGLDFIKAIQPVDYKWDFREDYRPAPPQAPGLNATQAELDEYAAAKAKYLEDIKFLNLTTDGTHKRTRYHHGVIAQQVQQVIEASGIDFGGFQDHKIKGGDDVLSVGYLEFIAPLIKAVQELAARVEALENP